MLEPPEFVIGKYSDHGKLNFVVWWLETLFLYPLPVWGQFYQIDINSSFELHIVKFGSNYNRFCQ
jgi:hypothetical protein